MKRSLGFLSLMSTALLLLTSLSCNLATNTKASISLSLGPTSAQSRSASSFLPMNYQWQSITVVVSAPDIQTIAQTFTLTSTTSNNQIELQVPTGSARTFKVSVKPLDPEGIFAVTEFAASQTIDVLANKANQLDLQVKPSSSRIVIPDARNQRLVMIDSLASGSATWKTLTATDINTDTQLATDFYPHDVEIDEQGRIIVAYGKSASGASSGGIIAIDHFVSGSQVIAYANIATLPTVGIAYNPSNQTLYALESTQTSVVITKKLKAYNLSTNSINGVEISPTLEPPDVLLLPPFANAYAQPFNFVSNGALAVGPDGSIYTTFSGTAPPNTQYLAKIHPNGIFDVSKTFSEIGLEAGQRISDLRFVDAKLYGLSLSTSYYTQGQLVELNPNTLDVIRSYGYSTVPLDLPSDANTTLNLIQPRAFAAVLNKKLVIVDEGGVYISSTKFDRLLALDSENFTGAEIFGQTGDGNAGSGKFKFYTEFYC